MREQWAGAGDAAHSLHRTAVEVADPHGHRESRGHAHRPVVGEVAAGAGLHGGAEGEVEWRLDAEAGHARDGIGKDIEHQRRRARGHDARAGAPLMDAGRRR